MVENSRALDDGGAAADFEVPAVETTDGRADAEGNGFEACAAPIRYPRDACLHIWQARCPEYPS